MFRRKYKNSVSILPHSVTSQILLMRKNNKGIFQRKYLEQTTEKTFFGEALQLAKQ